MEYTHTFTAHITFVDNVPDHLDDLMSERIGNHIEQYPRVANAYVRWDQSESQANEITSRREKDAI